MSDNDERALACFASCSRSWAGELRVCFALPARTQIDDKISLFPSQLMFNNKQESIARNLSY